MAKNKKEEVKKEENIPFKNVKIRLIIYIML